MPNEMFKSEEIRFTEKIVFPGKTKILFVITKSVWGGAQKYVFDLATNLPKENFDISVAFGGNGPLAEKLKENGIKIITIENFQRDINFISDFLAFFEILKILHKEKPNIVHANSSKAAGIAGITFLIHKIIQKLKFQVSSFKFQAVFTVHGFAFNESRPKWQIFLIKIFSRLTCFFYDKIICVSEFDRQAAIKNKIVSERKLVTVHNGIDTDERIFLTKEEAKQKFFNFQFSIFNKFSNSNFQNILIGTMGEFTKNKGQEYLIQAIAKIADTGYTIACVIIGWGEKISNLKSQISNLELENKVFLVKDVFPAMPYLKAFDIFVLPSLKEGLPYVLLEAGLAKLPVIATNVGGISEIIENEKTGLLVSPADVSALVSAIQELIEDKSLREKLAENLHQKIITEFSLEKMINRTLNVYLEIF